MPTHEQRSPEWFEARKGKITASIAAACLGLCPYTSRQEAWRRITGKARGGSNKHMQWGVEFENDAKASYECETGYLVEETGFWVHPTIPWLGASPDGLVGRVGMVEVKCLGKIPVAVPVHYRIQMLVQMACTGRKWVDFFAWHHEGTFLQRVFPAGTEGLIRKLEVFYKEFVLAGKEPPRKKRKRST